MNYTIGVDLGGTNIAAGLVDENYTLIGKLSAKTESEKGFDSVAGRMAELCGALLQNANIKREEVKSLGIGSPGTSDRDTGEIIFANNLHWSHVPLAASIRAQTGIATVVVGNDADCAALGEFVAGAGAEFSSLAMITIGTGVGSGIIMDGKVFAPRNSVAPELGHTTLIYGGELCTCGRRGCLESYASFTALIRDANRAADSHPDSMLAQLRRSGEKLNGKNVFETAKAGDTTSMKLVEQFIEYIAQGASNIANAFGV
ncbi:MAG: ROK family protein, partial [Pygmaiobacter sp.]